MDIIIAANSDKPKILADKIKNAVFLNLNEMPDTADNKKVLVLPCFIYGGYEYRKAVLKISEIYPNAEVMPPLISDIDDYFNIKDLLKDEENDIFCIHGCKLLDICDEALWIIGDDSTNIISYIKKHGFKTVGIKAILTDSKYHLKNDIEKLMTELEDSGIKCSLKLVSVFDSKKIIDLYLKRIEQYEINGTSETIEKKPADKGNGKGDLCTGGKTDISDIC